MASGQLLETQPSVGSWVESFCALSTWQLPHSWET